MGTDEAGRGALAGPVVAAAVVLDPKCTPLGLADSKKLGKQERSRLFGLILDTALAVGVGTVDNVKIDEINILRATFSAMHAALDSVLGSLPAGVDPMHVFVDGNRFEPWKIRHTCIIRGDALCASIAAASIVAKVTRDRYMETTAHATFPDYGFATHKGYGTAAHRSRLAELGACAIHRRTFLGKILQ